MIMYLLFFTRAFLFPGIHTPGILCPQCGLQACHVLKGNGSIGGIIVRIIHDKLFKRVYLIPGIGLSTLYSLVHLIYRTTFCNGEKAKLNKFFRDKQLASPELLFKTRTLALISLLFTSWRCSFFVNRDNTCKESSRRSHFMRGNNCDNCASLQGDILDRSLTSSHLQNPFRHIK